MFCQQPGIGDVQHGWAIDNHGIEALASDFDNLRQTRGIEQRGGVGCPRTACEDVKPRDPRFTHRGNNFGCLQSVLGQKQFAEPLVILQVKEPVKARTPHVRVDQENSLADF